MADTLTTNLKLTKMEIGAHNNTWGDVLNDNFDRIDAKMTAETEISTTGGTTTLSETEEEANVIDVAGALLSNAILVFSGRKGSWLIVNDTSGAFSLTAKVSGQTGITITQGETKLVRCDGTDIRNAASALTQLTQDLDANGFYIGFDDLTGIKDDAGNKQLVFGKTASAVNYFKMVNAAAAGYPTLVPLGTDTDIGILFSAKGAGQFKFGATLKPSADDGAALGVSGTAFSDLFLALGAVINFNAGDVTITHSANVLAFAGASSGYTFDVVPTVGGSTVALLGTEDQTLAGGARVTVKDLGTVSSGTVTPDPGDRPMQKYTNNGAHTLAPGSNVGSYILTILNGASAGVITISGWTKTAGSFDTTNAHKFRCFACIDDTGASTLFINNMF